MNKKEILFWCEDYANGSFPVKSCSNCTILEEQFECCPPERICKKWQGELKGEPIRLKDKCWKVNESTLEYDFWFGPEVKSGHKYFSNKQNAENYQDSLKQRDMQKVEIEIPENYQVTDTFENKITDNLTLKGVILEKKQHILTTKDNVNLYLGDTFYFIDETNTINESKIVNPNFEILSEYLHFSTKEAAQNYLNSLLKANTGKFEVGDKVKVVRKAESREGDWKTSWLSDMNISIGKTFTVLCLRGLNGYLLNDNSCNFCYPEFVLELVEKPLVKVENKFIYLSDLKENKVYYSENNNGKKVIWRFKSVRTGSKINNGFINANTINITNQNFNKTGVNDQWWNNLREATSEEIQHLERCEYFGKYVDPLILEENKWYETHLKSGEIFYTLYQSNRENYCGFNSNQKWSEHISNKYALPRMRIPANMDKVETLLFEKAKKDYPIGTKFDSVLKNHPRNKGIVTTIHIDLHFNLRDIDQVIHTNNQYLYIDDKWAEIINEEFKVGDWVVFLYSTIHPEFMGKIGKIDEANIQTTLEVSCGGISLYEAFYNVRKATKKEVKEYLQEKANKEIEETLKNFDE